MEFQIPVSVVIPVFNSGKYLRTTLDSVISQTFKEIEIICVDDGSTDSSMDILQEYASKDARIRIIERHIRDCGAGGARNMGIDAAQGCYLAFLDADDIFEQDMLEKLYRNAVSSEADIVVCDSYVYRSDKGLDVFNGIVNRDYLNSECVFDPAERADHLFQLVGSAVWNKLFLHSFVKDNQIRFREDINIIDDSEFVYVAAAVAGRISIIFDRLIHYRRDAEGSQTSKYDKCPEIIYRPWAYLKKNLESRGIYDKYRVTFSNRVLEYIRFLLLNLKTLQGYEKAYELLKETGMDELGFKLDGSYPFSWQKSMIDSIFSCSPYEFLFRFTRGNPLYSGYNLSLPFSTKERRRVALYGAGECGKKVVENIRKEKGIELVSWHDRNYKAIGLNVESPESIAEKKYDYVFVAIVDEKIFHKIEVSLIDHGVDRNKIVWIGTPWN